MWGRGRGGEVYNQKGGIVRVLSLTIPPFLREGECWSFRARLLQNNNAGRYSANHRNQLSDHCIPLTCSDVCIICPLIIRVHRLTGWMDIGEYPYIRALDAAPANIESSPVWYIFCIINEVCNDQSWLNHIVYIVVTFNYLLSLIFLDCRREISQIHGRVW